MKNIFTEHPQSVGETYFVHFKYAISLSFYTMAASLACLMHAFFPFLFQTTGSNLLIKVMHRLIERRTSLEGKLAELMAAMERKRSR